jgi:predicted DNA-binding transcriptional regulator YafY
LADILEVSRRTVMRDVDALGRMGVSVISRSGPGGCYEMDSEQTLRPLELTGSEAFLLMLALDALQKLADVPFELSRETLSAKVRALLPSAQFERAFSRVGTVHLDVPTRLNRSPNLGALVERCGQWAELSYSSDEGPATYLARVERVFADRGLWYLECLWNGKRRNLRVDRVLHVKPSEAPSVVAEPKPYNDPSHPLVQVTMTARGLRQLERDPHLGGDVHGKTGPAKIEFHCPPEELDWYARYFGGMGADAEIHGPPELIAIIVSKSRQLLEKYEKT